MGKFAAVDNFGEIPNDIKTLLDVSPERRYKQHSNEVFILSRRLLVAAPRKLFAIMGNAARLKLILIGRGANLDKRTLSDWANCLFQTVQPPADAPFWPNHLNLPHSRP